MYRVPIGRYTQLSDKIIVSDPSYEYIPKEHLLNNKLGKLNLVIENVKNGDYNIILHIMEYEKERNAELICCHETINLNTIKNSEWIEIGDIGVDSGQAGVYDLKYYPKEKNNEWYRLNTNITSKPTDYAGSIPHGAVSSSGYGDGIYSVYIVKRQKVIAVKITFIDDKIKDKYRNIFDNIQ